jgi:hypothetical protein
MKGAEQELTNNNYKLEMNELIESEPEEYQPDLEDLCRNERESSAEKLSDKLNALFDRETSLETS